jgi:hypothetical protein
MRGAAICVALFAALWPAASRAGPDPAGAGTALADSTLAAAGDLVGAAGLTGGAVVGAVGDLVQLVDGNRVSRPVLQGLASRGVHTVAFGISWSGTSLLEILRRGDIERLPEPYAAYVEAEYGAGRLTTFLDGLGALWLGVGDLLSGPARFGLRLVGAEGTATALETSRREAAVRWLGPPPLPPETPPDP